MAINMGYPNAGITSVIGQQGNPMGGVQQPVNTNQFNPQESIEDTIIRLYQTNVPIDQIAQMTGTDPNMVAQVINSSTGADTMSNMRPPPPPQGAPQMGMPQETFSPNLPTDNVFTRQPPPGGAPQMGMPQETFDTNLPSGPPPRPESIGAQTLTAINPGYARENPDAIGEAERMDAQVQRTSREVFGIGEEDPDLVQEINAVELSVLEDFESEGDGQSSGVSGAVQENALMKIGLNDVFTNAGIGLEDRIDFFKHYIAETMGIDYENLKEAPDQGMPYLAAASALLNASKSGDSRMSGLGQALVSFGTTKRQIERVNNKEAQNLLMTSFNLGLESMKIAQSSTGKMGATEWVTVPWSNDPVLLPKESIVAAQQSGAKVLPYNKDKDAKRTLYSIPRMTKDGVMFDYKKLTEAQYQRQLELQDSELTANGYEIQEADNSDRSKNILYTDPVSGDQEVITQADYFSLPFDKQTGFKSMVNTTPVIDTDEGNKQVWVSSEELANAPDGKYTSLNYGTYFSSDGEGGFTFSQGKGIDGGRPDQTPGGLVKVKAAISVPLKAKIKQSMSTLDLLERARDLSKAGLFGDVSRGVAKVGNFLKSAEEVSNAFQDSVTIGKKADYGRMKREWYAKVEADAGFQAFIKRTGANKERLLGTQWSLALASAQILNDQKGRDISNVDAERFLTRVGANASSAEVAQMMLDDLEDDLLNAQLNNFAIEESSLESFPTGDLDEEGNEIMQRILSRDGELFGIGGLVETRRKELNRRLNKLKANRVSMSAQTGELVSDIPRPKSFSDFEYLINKDVNQKGEGATIVSPNSRPDAEVSWGTLAKIIYRDQFQGNDTMKQRGVKIAVRIQDHFPGDEDRANEFKVWYNSILKGN